MLDRPAVVEALACTSSYHDVYRSAHPGWSARTFPHAKADLAETLAALEAPPDARERTTLQRRRIVNVTGARWKEIAPGTIESDAYRPSPLHAYLVPAEVACAATTADAWVSNDDAAWYLLLDGQLTGYRHVVYDRGCRGDVRTVRPPLSRSTLSAACASTPSARRHWPPSIWSGPVARLRADPSR